MSDPILRLTWANTGDYFDIEAENPKFAEWFVEQCATLGNQFGYVEDPPQQDQLIAQVKNNIQEVNQFLKKINFPELTILDDLYSQHNLNAIHKNWISLVRKESRLDKILYYHDPELFDKFHAINKTIHKIENKFSYRCVSNPPWRVDNKFKDITPPYGIYNLSVCYTDWGKSSWDKFKDGAEDPTDFELSSWETIGSIIDISLCKTYGLTFPPEYLKYCSKHNIATNVKTWPLGNLVDYEKTMPSARMIMNKNVQIPNNKLNFSIL